LGTDGFRAGVKVRRPDGSTVNVWRNLIAPDAFGWLDFSGELTVTEAGIGWWPIIGGQTNTGTDVRLTWITAEDVTKAAEVETQVVTKIDAAGAVSAVNAQVSVASGGQKASVTELTTAQETIEGQLAAYYGISVDGGGNGAFLNLLDDSSLGSAITLGADQIILDGDVLVTGSLTEEKAANNAWTDWAVVTSSNPFTLGSGSVTLSNYFTSGGSSLVEVFVSIRMSDVDTTASGTVLRGPLVKVENVTTGETIFSSLFVSNPLFSTQWDGQFYFSRRRTFPVSAGVKNLRVSLVPQSFATGGSNDFEESSVVWTEFKK